MEVYISHLDTRHPGNILHYHSRRRRAAAGKQHTFSWYTRSALLAEKGRKGRCKADDRIGTTVHCGGFPGRLCHPLFYDAGVAEYFHSNLLAGLCYLVFCRISNPAGEKNEIALLCT